MGYGPWKLRVPNSFLVSLRQLSLSGQYLLFATITSEVAQSCPTLCSPMDCSLPGSSIHGVFQARVLEWVAISFYLLGVTKNLTLMIMNDSYPESWSLRLSA